MRRGITLLEVLISIGVMAIGLLALLALLPLGHFKMAQAIKDDRSSTLARSALDDLAIRGYLQPERWLVDSTSGTPVLNPTTGALVPLPPYAIDPLAMANPQNATAPLTFPSVPLTPASAASRITLCSILRGLDGQWGIAGVDDDTNGVTDDVSEAYWPGSDDGVAIPFALAGRIFGSEDDVVYDIPKNPDFRTTIVASPAGAGSPVNAAGDYTWLATVSPSLDDLRSGAMRNFSVAVVVFQKRNLVTPPNTPIADPPQERMVFADFPTAGVAFGGGDVQLRTTGGAKWLDLKPNQWLMLSASFVDPYLDSSFTDTNGNGWSDPGEPRSGDGRRTLLRWYRVAAVDEGTQSAAGEWSRYVTLAGPDWPAMGGVYDDADTSNPLSTVYATICDGAVAVHEQTLKLEGLSVWQ